MSEQALRNELEKLRDNWRALAAEKLKNPTGPHVNVDAARLDFCADELDDLLQRAHV